MSSITIFRVEMLVFIFIKESAVKPSIKKNQPWWRGVGWGAWVAPSWLSVQLLILAPVKISWFVSSSPALGSTLAMQSLLGILSPSLSAPLPVSLSLKISKLKKERNTSLG